MANTCACGCGRPIRESSTYARGHNMKAPLRERFNEKVEKRPGCWTWEGAKTRGGYGHIYDPSKPGNRRAHRVSWSLHRGSIPDGAWVLHDCDNPECVNPEHLFLGNRSDNMRDASVKGRLNTQDPWNRPGTRLNPVAARAIRYFAVKTDRPYKEIAEVYGVNPTSVSDIANGVTWPDAGGVETKGGPKWNRRSPLNEGDIRAIRRRADAGETYQSIASDYPVGRHAISNIARRESWGWVPENN